MSLLEKYAKHPEIYADIFTMFRAGIQSKVECETLDAKDIEQAAVLFERLMRDINNNNSRRVMFTEMTDN